MFILDSNISLLQTCRSFERYEYSPDFSYDVFHSSTDHVKAQVKICEQIAADNVKMKLEC